MPDDNILSQKYRDTGIPLHIVSSSIVRDNFCKKCNGFFVDNFCKNPTVRIVCSALADFLSHKCVLMLSYVNFLPLDVVVVLLAFILEF